MSFVVDTWRDVPRRVILIAGSLIAAGLIGVTEFASVLAIPPAAGVAAAALTPKRRGSPGEAVADAVTMATLVFGGACVVLFLISFVWVLLGY